MVRRKGGRPTLQCTCPRGTNHGRRSATRIPLSGEIDFVSARGLCIYSIDSTDPHSAVLVYTYSYSWSGSVQFTSSVVEMDDVHVRL